MKQSFRSLLRCAGLRCGLAAVLVGLLSVSAEAAKAPKMLDIADTVSTNRILTKFAQMMQSSDMTTFLSTKGPFTLFVPTDSAFSKLPPGTLEALLLPENKERLQAILLYHVVNGKRLTAKDLAVTPSVLSCQGAPLTIHKTKSGTQTVMKAKIIHADIRCQNGIINEIDTVLMPPEKALPPLAPPPPPGATPPPSTAPATPDPAAQIH